MDRKEKIALSSLTVAISALIFNVLINWEKASSVKVADWWERLNIQIPISIWVLLVLILSSLTILWFNRPKKKKLKIVDVHVSIMKVIANNNSPERDQILEILLKNKIEITKTRLELYLSELKANDYIDSYMGGYWLEDKARSFLVNKGYD